MESQKEVPNEQLNLSPIVDVWGVVSGHVGLGIGKDDELWTMTFTFDAWKLTDGELRTQPLLVRRRIRKEDFPHINSFDVVHIRARIIRNTELDQLDAELEAVVGIVSADTELNEIVLRLRQPVHRHEPPLPELVLIDSYWLGEINLRNWEDFYVKSGFRENRIELSIEQVK